MDEGQRSGAIIIASSATLLVKLANRVIGCYLHLSSIGYSASLLHPAKIEGEILRDSELAAQIVYLFGVERADDVDDHDLFRAGDQHADAFNYGAVVDHQEDLDVFSFAFAAHADYPIPARRGELLANRFDIGVTVFALFVELHAFDVNALERQDELFD